jgi:serine/threonine protein kinase
MPAVSLTCHLRYDPLDVNN